MHVQMNHIVYEPLCSYNIIIYGHASYTIDIDNAACIQLKPLISTQIKQGDQCEGCLRSRSLYNNIQDFVGELAYHRSCMQI